MYSSDLQGEVTSSLSVASRDRTAELVESEIDGGQVVSFYSELPAPLQVAMTSFIERYPNWDQYRLIQAALAGFLVQNGVQTRPITRLYVGNMFGSKAFRN